ncbi:MAG: hypothetical protein RO257_08190 [Candidatus Kapabacteria bacterium]|nr:hypothetical protein [Candidatus Kapabacteria bacterium]
MNKQIEMKEFDCLEYKYRVQKIIFKNIQNLTIDEEKSYFNSKIFDGSFKDLIKNLGISV